MNKRLSYIVILVLLFVGTSILKVSNFELFASDDKVKICHSTSSTSNPYIKNEPLIKVVMLRVMMDM